jgi:hypothetical protein
MLKTKTKNLKPIDIDGHFKYRCPSCGIDHWASFKEASTKNFIIVCDCSQTFTIKRIVDTKIVFAKKKATDSNKKKEVQENVSVVKKCRESVNIPEITLDKATKMMVALGFTKDESESMLKSSYQTNPTENIALLVKSAVTKIGGFNG